MSISLYIVDYSEKAIALFGETKPYKNKITELGGKFNPSLKVENSEDRKAGWIFPKSKRKVVEQLINDIDNGTVQPMSLEEEKTYSKPISSSSSSSLSSTSTGVSKQDFMNLLSKVERLEQEVNNLKSMLNGGSNTTVTKSTSVVKKQKIPDPSDDEQKRDDDDDDEEEQRPKGRIMKKK